MSNADTSGAAFPCALGWVETDMNSGAQTCVDVRDVSHGMSLRDYFAARALAPAFPGMTTRDVQYAAEAAYELADAMLAARSA
ncbi:hypothetical protein HX859_02695 [Pseudomonas gingeri]|uniref:hypothetical protein n=1 Tax=Pseudomonas gingeri TaxID=117681 RepID=UPI0015A2B745|nr:hypothetical protein [Pseudomonas gingeri]NVZ73783.1 hypothetical protein [Pseudomonas gingeri]NWE46368.1 hypothetical protein [Pseudomonas gingeri]